MPNTVNRPWLQAALVTIALAAPRFAAASPADCPSYVDHTAAGASRTLSWVLSLSSNPDRCMKIQVGQTVTWSGSFSTHPLLNDGGDSPNPIAGHDATGNVTFTAAGTYGYICGVHATMTGAIQVVAPAAVVPALGGRLPLLMGILVLAGAILVVRRFRSAR
jgi:plastocyanin